MHVQSSKFTMPKWRILTEKNILETLLTKLVRTELLSKTDKRKDYAIAAEILAILDEIPLGQHKMEIGLQLRQAMLVNGMLFNSEAWHDVSEKEIKMMETVDEYLLRSLVKGHSKTPLEFLYL